jgi:hypothetical protein
MDLSVIETWALKNRTGGETLADLVIILREFRGTQKEGDLKLLLEDSLVNRPKAEGLFDFLAKILKFENTIESVTKDNAIKNVERWAPKHATFNQYDINDLNLDEDQKKDFSENFHTLEHVFKFIPFWYVALVKQDEYSS